MPIIKQIQVGDTSYDIKDDISRYQTEADVDAKVDLKQDILISGTNIKTINYESILGEGNIEIQGGGGTSANDGKLTIERNGIELNHFTANQATDTTINIQVPTNNNELANGAGYVTTSDLAPVAVSGSYNDLTSKPGEVALAPVAISNDYNDLDNKYILPAATNTNLGGIKKGEHVNINNGVLSTIVDQSLSDTSTEAIANKIVKSALDDKLNKTDPVFRITKDADGKTLDEPIEFSILDLIKVIESLEN